MSFLALAVIILRGNCFSPRAGTSFMATTLGVRRVEGAGIGGMVVGEGLLERGIAVLIARRCSLV